MRSFVLLCASLCFAILSFESVAAQKKMTSEWTEYQSVFDKDGKSNAAIRGVWHAEGYGMVAEITDSKLRVFEFYRGGGWVVPDDDIPELIFRKDKKSDRCQIAFHPMNGVFDLKLLKEIPPQCLEKKKWTPTELFDAFAGTMNDYYAFFDLYDIDWSARVRSAREKVSNKTSEKELFEIFKGLLKGINDAHTRLLAKIDGKVQVVRLGESKTLTSLRAIHKKQGGKSSFGEFMDERAKSYLAGVTEFLGKEPKTKANRILWGRNKDDIGYIMVKGMGGFSDDENLDGQLAALHRALDEILVELKDTKAMIVDVSLNGGGMDLFSLAIATHFADKRRLGFSKYPAKFKKYRRDVFVEPYVDKNGKQQTYTKPVIVVTSDVTVSAAEIFVMCMRAFPHIKTAGLTTRGALSDVLEKTLPNGWELGLSNEVYLDHRGICHESKGIKPDIPLKLFDTSGKLLTHKKALKELAKKLDKD